jgi:hypothetical protein
MVSSQQDRVLLAQGARENSTNETAIVNSENTQDIVREPLHVGEQMNALGDYVTLLNHPVRALFTGRSTLGKTTLAVDVIMSRIIPHVQQVFAVCPTFWHQHQLSRLREIPQCFTEYNVFTEVDDSVFDNIYHILSAQDSAIPTLLFVDDSAAEQATNMGNKGAFSRLCLATPHLNLSIFGIFQRLRAASCSLRANTEAVISFIPSKVGDVDVIQEEFNPYPAMGRKGKQVVAQALTQAWQSPQHYVFIWRPPRKGVVLYHEGFETEIEMLPPHLEHVKDAIGSDGS